MTPFKKLAREEALGRYRLIARLGRGGMAEVFLARLVGAGGFEKLVAIKRMLPTLSGDDAFVAMFLKEGRIAAQLDHPNVCHVYELGDESGTLYLAMEFLRGLPWSEISPAIPDRPRATLARFVVGAIAQACEGLHHAHTAVGASGQPFPIVHRDVSPSNLFVTTEGIVKLLDFGVSKVLTEASATATGTHKGKLPYMAPEQLRGQPVDLTADIFSLAVVTWEALAGRALFDRTSDFDTMVAVAETAIPALPGDEPVIARLDAVLRRALARDQAHRHRSAREFAGDLRQAIAAWGEPMNPSDLHAHVSTWLAPSLARRSRDLAELVGRRPEPDDLTGERTALHEPAPAAGVRLRDASVVVGEDMLVAGETTPDMLGTPPSEPAPRTAAPADGLAWMTPESPPEPPARLPQNSRHRARRAWSLASQSAASVIMALVVLAAGVIVYSLRGDGVRPEAPVVAARAVAAPVVAARAVEALVIDAAVTPDEEAARPSSTSTATHAAAPASASQMVRPETSPPPPNRGPSSNDPAALYEQRKYPAVVQACSAKISVEVASPCVLAACQQRNAAKAAKWQLLVPSAAERNQLAIGCRQLSKGAVQLESRSGARRPALDCARNPLDCR